MLRLLTIEFQKMRYSRAAKVLIIIYFSLFLSIVLFSSIHFQLGPVDFQLADQGIFNFPYIWHFNSYFAALLKIFLAVVIVSMISTEYSNRTLKQNLIDGMSKKEFVLSKFYAIIGFSVVSTVFLFLVSLVLGLIFSDYDEPGIIFSNMQYLGGYFLKLTAFFSFCFFLGVWVKRSAFAIGALFIWWIAEVIIRVSLRVSMRGSDLPDRIVQFLPLESMANLIREPFTKMSAVKQGAQQFGLSHDSTIYWYQIVIVLVWTAIFIYSSYALIKKRDL